ncbi:peptidase [Thalassotalea sp. M1531]|uniref:Peptidase n=1 Tax=Thalassotalea algicola TaxID=2716224 RepID=A0A7Y0Q4L4_9GAMM|nr:M14 family zinc carboxypeptidase [Thalassotalea algicola]NMP30094.1 peptidase [Thalassotalea algicola]
MSNLRLIFVFLALVLVTQFTNATVLMKPTPLTGLEYPDILSGAYQENITTPETFLGFKLGERTASPEQINALVNLWAKESDKVQIVEYARSYENRALHYLMISTPNNLSRLPDIKANIAQLSEPAKLSASKIKQLIEDTPATAWMAYSIHGNENSGADGALALIYHLIASKNNDVNELLANMVVLVDPMMNPDGRARFTKRLEESRGTAPNIDDNSLLHSGTWPFGRTNHYYFDLNRDFYFAVNPESRGRIKAINQWFPQLMIDGHEMGPQDTYLFGPPREPLNVHIPASTRKWSKVFSLDHAEKFDENNWPYYTGEWFENLYPGYSNYAEYKGSMHILYEQASTDEDGIKLASGKIRTFKEAVDHQFTSSMANLTTLSKHSKAMYQDFVQFRKGHVATKGQYSNRSFVVLPTGNHYRTQRFLDLLDIQGFEYQQTTKSFTVSKAKNQLGQNLTKVTVPKGSIVINNRQYDAPLLATLLEFDTEIKDQVLIEERQKTLRNGSSVMYDTTAWNITMMYGLEALEVNENITKNLTNYQAPTPQFTERENTIAYLVDGATDSSVAFAARLLEQGVKVRVLDKEGKFNQQGFARGSVVVYHYDNTMDKSKLKTLVKQTANETNSSLVAINQGLGDGDLPDIGGESFKLLTAPKVGLISQNGINFYDLGSIWHLLDTELGIRHSHLNQEFLANTDLRAYNVLVLPSRFYGELPKHVVKQIGQWVTNGGTLIVSGSSANQLLATEKFTQVKLLKDSFKESEEYNLALFQEWLAKQSTISNAKQVAANKVSNDIWYPWQDIKALKPMDEKALKQWNNWNQRFMPSGAITATRTDQKHWLTYGVPEQLPVLTSNLPLLMSKGGSDAVVRFGQYVSNSKAEASQIGWSTIPAANDVYLRMSGLLWPEAAQRITNAAYLTREAKGKGQIILFAGEPNFRGASKGTARLLLNAIVYGPGLGTQPFINL